MDKQRRILVVDDNAVNRTVTCELLRCLGFAVDAAADGVLALDAIAREHFDAVFMDLQMPAMDGLETVRAVRALESANSLPRLPIIALTADAFDTDRHRALAAGMDDYIAKPARAERLRSVLERCWASSIAPPQRAPGD